MTKLTFLIARRPAQLALAALVALYIALGAAYATAAPALEKPDEEWHLAYVLYLLDHGRLPPITPDAALNPARQEAGQPPLFYALAASGARLFGWQVSAPTLRPNPYWAYPAPGTANDNKNRYVHAPGEWGQDALKPLLWLRFLSLALGAGAVVSAYGLGQALTGRRSLGLAAAAVVAFLPQYLFIASSISNDALVTALSGAALWALVVALRAPEGGDSTARPTTPLKPWLLFGLLAGLAALTKTSALLVPCLGVGAAWLDGLRRRTLRPAVAGTLAGLGGLLLCAGWWYARNTVLYGDPLGLGIHFQEMGRSTALAGTALASQWQAIEVSFWAAFGWGNVTLPDPVYVGLRVATGLAVAGAAVAWIGKPRPGEQRAALGLMALFVIGVGASLAWWTRAVSASLGRLIFPALAPLAVLLAWAWARLWRRLPLLAAGFLGSLALIAPLFIAGAYLPPTLYPEPSAPVGMEAANANVGDVARLYAYRISPARAAPGQEVHVSLCWQARDKTAEDYSVFVHLVGQKDVLAGQRQSYPGLGRYATSLWRPGDAFCDDYAVPIAAHAAPNALYAVETGLFDLRTGARLPISDGAGRAVNPLVLGQVKVTGPGRAIPPSAARLDVGFGRQITLAAYQVGTGRPGSELPLTLYWQADAAIDRDYTVFVHLLDDGGRIVAQADAPPQAGRYPTHWWDTGEVVADPHPLSVPPSLPAGSYRLAVGLYRPENGERLPLSRGAGDRAEIGRVQIGTRQAGASGSREDPKARQQDTVANLPASPVEQGQARACVQAIEAHFNLVSSRRSGGWDAEAMRVSQVFPRLPERRRILVAQRRTIASAGDGSGAVQQVNEHLVIGARRGQHLPV